MQNPSQSLVPSTCPCTVPSNDGAAVALSLSHSSGVWHLAVQAWMAAISCFSAELTRRWRFSELRPWNCAETMRLVNAWPQPPVDFCEHREYLSRHDKAMMLGLRRVFFL